MQTMSLSGKTTSPSSRRGFLSPRLQASSGSSFRTLYTRVLLGLQAIEHPVLGVTSAIAGEGKTTIASGLAAALAEDGALSGFGREPDTTLLIECNVGAPPQDPRLAVSPGRGLIEVLRGECAPEAAIQETGVERLSMMPLGAPADAHAHSLPLAVRTAALPDLIAQLRSQFGLIVLDLPDVLNSTDTEILARFADQLLLVIRAGVTPAKLVRQALDQLGEDMLLGVVLNESRPDLPPWLDNRL